MNRKEVSSQVQDIFRDVLDDEKLILSDETTANDVEDWDSLSHIQLVVAIEKQFNMKFSAKEILSWKNVGDMVDRILSK